MNSPADTGREAFVEPQAEHPIDRSGAKGLHLLAKRGDPGRGHQIVEHLLGVRLEDHQRRRKIEVLSRAERGAPAAPGAPREPRRTLRSRGRSRGDGGRRLCRPRMNSKTFLSAAASRPGEPAAADRTGAFRSAVPEAEAHPGGRFEVSCRRDREPTLPGGRNYTVRAAGTRHRPQQVPGAHPARGERTEPGERTGRDEAREHRGPHRSGVCHPFPGRFAQPQEDQGHHDGDGGEARADEKPAPARLRPVDAIGPQASQQEGRVQDRGKGGSRGRARRVRAARRAGG